MACPIHMPLFHIRYWIVSILYYSIIDSAFVKNIRSPKQESTPDNLFLFGSDENSHLASSENRQQPRFVYQIFTALASRKNLEPSPG